MNGEVSGIKNPDFFNGQIRCHPGYHLVGNPRVKCSRGQWSGPLPVCTQPGSCDTLEVPRNGRVIPVRGTMNSAYRFRCNHGFELVGERSSVCHGSSWSHSSLPVCVKAGCQDTGMLDIPHGEARRMLRGAMYRYRCDDGLRMEGDSSVYCDGENWNGTIPTCLVPPTTPVLELLVDGVPSTEVSEGSTVLVTCYAKTGNPVPDIQISFADETASFTNFKNSMTFTASPSHSGLVVTCTARNTAGTTQETALVTVTSPPTHAIISGPTVGRLNTDYTYTCSVLGGNPAPEITWEVKDTVGNYRTEKGVISESGMSTIHVTTGQEDRKVTVTCFAENSEGRVEDARQLIVQYLPASVSVTGPGSSTPGSLELKCSALPALPQPTLTWKVKTEDHVTEYSGDSSFMITEHGGVQAENTLSLDVVPGALTAECVASVEGLGEVVSNMLEMTVLPATTKPTTTTTLHTTVTTTTTTTTTTPESTTTKSVSMPVVFGIRPNSVLRPGQTVVVTCSSEGHMDTLLWEVITQEGTQLRGEGADVMRKGGKVISSWEYQASLGDSMILCKVEGQERTGSIHVTVRKEQEPVTLEEYPMEEYSQEEENMENTDEESGMTEMEDWENYETNEFYDNAEEDYGVDATDEDHATAVDAIGTMMNAQMEEKQTFSDSEPVARIPEVAVEDTPPFEVAEPKSSFHLSDGNSGSSILLPSFVLLLTLSLKYIL